MPALGLLLLVGCAGGDGEASAARSSGTPTASPGTTVREPPQDDAGAPSVADLPVVHVHALDVDPADGALLVATHTGLLRAVDGDDPGRPGPATWDLMGFAVAEPGTYVASGHPGAGDPGPGLAGLLRSEDGGRTWEQVSLAGEADFHALDADGDVVAGANSADGRLYLSEDQGESWDVVAPPGPVADLVVLADEGRLLVATPDGPLVGALDDPALEPVTSAPLVRHLAAGEDGLVVGVTTDGAVHLSEDAGTTWTAAVARADGAVVATAVDAAGDLVVLDDTGATSTVALEGTGA